MESVATVPAPRCAILYLHGGAFVFGSASSYRSRSLRLAHRCHAEVFLPEYRLAPEHPYPAALEDALTAWEHLHRIRPTRATPWSRLSTPSWPRRLGAFRPREPGRAAASFRGAARPSTGRPGLPMSPRSGLCRYRACRLRPLKRVARRG
jgi:hypothetical protein